MINGNTLRLIRNWKGMAQKQAAALLAISQPRYSHLEKKKEINGVMYERIKKAFKLTDDDINQLINLPPPRKMTNAI